MVGQEYTHIFFETILYGWVKINVPYSQRKICLYILQKYTICLGKNIFIYVLMIFHTIGQNHTHIYSKVFYKIE